MKTKIYSQRHFERLSQRQANTLFKRLFIAEATTLLIFMGSIFLAIYIAS